jgi:hypothetical protein
MSKKVDVNLVVYESLLADLQSNCASNRNGYRSKVKGATPVDGVDVTVPDDHAMQSDPHIMTDEELLEYVVYQLANNRPV